MVIDLSNLVSDSPCAHLTDTLLAVLAPPSGFAVLGARAIRSLHGGIVNHHIVREIIGAITAARDRSTVRSHEVVLPLIVAPNPVAALVQQLMVTPTKQHEIVEACLATVDLCPRRFFIRTHCFLPSPTRPWDPPGSIDEGRCTDDRPRTHLRVRSGLKPGASQARDGHCPIAGRARAARMPNQ
jgi:hypothetical protein